MNSETQIIASLAKRLKSPSTSNVLIGIGDDTALVECDSSKLLITTDALLEGIHFDLQSMPLALVGRKALAVNLSDIAAMAGIPLFAVVALAIPKTAKLCDIDTIYEGMSSIANEYEVAVIGGDTNTWKGPWCLSVTLVGRPHHKGVVTRSGAKPGDSIFVTGQLGGSFLSGKHLSFTPRFHEAWFLHEHYNVHSMMDISDGVASDLPKMLAHTPALGAQLFRDAIPRGGVLLKNALCDGEDFELLFTLDDSHAREIMKNPDRFFPVSRIGTVISKPGIFWEDGTPMNERGYEHELTG